MLSKDSAHPSSPRDLAEHGEAIYRSRYQTEFEERHAEKFVAINLRNEDATVAESSEDAVHFALQKDPQGILFLIRVGHPAAFDAGWYLTCAS